MTFFYLTLSGSSSLYAVLIIVFGQLGHIHLPFHFHIGTPGVDTSGTGGMPSLSPITVASFVLAFGAFGLIGEYYSNESVGWSILAATAGGIIVAVIAHFAFGFFLIAPQGSSEVTMKDILGADAEVITPIPADSIGQIALVAQGGRITYPAKSATGQAIGRNTTVTVERVVGTIAFVRPQD